MAVKKHHQQIWLDLASCNTFYPNCCELIDAELWLKYLEHYPDLDQLDVSMGDILLAVRVLSGYTFFGICDICHDYIMAGAI